MHLLGTVVVCVRPVRSRVAVPSETTTAVNPRFAAMRVVVDTQ